MSKNSNKKANSRLGIFIGGAFVIVILALYLLLFYPWPSQNANLSGTIGGVEKAKKYNAGQISDKDVAVQEGIVQKLIQNDKVLKIINDPNFQKLASDNALKQKFDNMLTNAVAKALKANQLTANELTANKMTANKLTANKMAANELTANKMAANELTANKMTANELTANKMTANELTANKMTANALKSVENALTGALSNALRDVDVNSLKDVSNLRKADAFRSSIKNGLKSTIYNSLKDASSLKTAR